MKALEVLKDLKENPNRKFLESTLNEAIKELESMKHSNHSTTADIPSKEYCVSLEKRITHIENTLEQIFRASAYNKDALNKNHSVWNYFKSRR